MKSKPRFPTTRSRAWQNFQAAADALRGILPAPPKVIPTKQMPVPVDLVAGIRARSESALRMAREVGFAVDMKNNWPMKGASDAN